MKQILEILKSVPLFSGFTDQECSCMVPLLHAVHYSSGEVVLRQGDSGETMFLLSEGVVEVWRNDNHDGKVSLGVLTEGQFFGELSLIDNLPRSATVEAISDIQLYQMEKADFDKLLQENVVLANKFYSNCINETFIRFRNIVANFTFSQYTLKEKTAALDEINLDLQHAKRMQRYFIDSDYLDTVKVLPGGVRQSYLYRPCKEIGGDFLNLFPLHDEKVAVLIADVAGHGITAALATGVIKSGLQLFAPVCGERPPEIVSQLNNHLYEIIDDNFSTCIYALIDPSRHEVTFAKAGHPYPLVSRKDGTLLKMELKGPALGIFPGSRYTEYTFTYEPGDRILFFTDGIIEQRGVNGEMYDENRLASRFSSLAKEGCDCILPYLFSDLASFAGTESFEDDITLLLLEF